VTGIFGGGKRKAERKGKEGPQIKFKQEKTDGEGGRMLTHDQGIGQKILPRKGKK